MESHNAPEGGMFTVHLPERGFGSLEGLVRALRSQLENDSHFQPKLIGTDARLKNGELVSASRLEGSIV